MYFNKKRVICTLDGGSLKLVDKYLGSRDSSTESDTNMRLAKA